MRLYTIWLIATLALVILTAPLAAEVQQPGKVYRIAILLAGSPPPPSSRMANQLDAFWQGMRELGWMEGQNIVVERRWAEQRLDRLPALATELVQLKVDLIVVSGGVTIGPAKKATSTIPIVMLSTFDAVEQGYVTSLAHPGANVTGLTMVDSDLHQKRLELLKEAVLGISRIASLRCKRAYAEGVRGMQLAARALGVQLQDLEVREPDDYEGAFAAAISERAEAMAVIACAANVFNQQRVVDLAAKHRLPAIYNTRDWVDAGGLMSYGPSLPALARRAATYVDKILKGAKPADLPVEQPTTFELVINLKTAHALGLTIPPSLLFQADEVIR